MNRRNIMKKIGIIAVLAIIAFTVGACKTADDGDAAYKKVYDRYFGDLILTGAETYTVVSGDTLSKISADKYNNGLYYPVILMASKETIVDVDKIKPGMKLTIPVLKTNLDDVKARSSIKKCLKDVSKIEKDRKRSDTASKMLDLSNSL